jgi:hypothetical protein
MPPEFFTDHPADHRVTHKVLRGTFDSNLVFPGSLRVTVRLAWNFGHSWRRNKFGGSAVWTPDQREQFKDSHRNIVKDYWDARYGIVIRHKRTGETRTIVPEFTVEDVTDGGGESHYQMWVSALPTWESYVSERGDDPRGELRCKLHRHDADADPSHSVVRNIHAWMLKRGVVDQMRKAIGDLAQGGVKFDPGSAALDDENRQKLNDLASFLRVDLPVFPQLELKVKSYRVPNEAADLDRKRFEAVRGYLVRRGFPAECFRRKPEGTVKAPSVVARVRGRGQERPYVTLQFRKSSAVGFLDGRLIYPIAAHEFGHQLGLLDEYPFSGRELARRAPQRGPYLDLCTKFNAQPAPFNSNTLSLMSSGNHVLPCHYVPLAEAVHEHLRHFYGDELIPRRLARTRPGLLGAEKREVIDKMRGEKEENLKGYEITIGALRRTVGTEPVALTRYAPLEAAPDLVMIE